jgi:hypothetical protein
MLPWCLKPSRLPLPLLCLLLAGCGSGRAPVFPVHGRVLDARGKPAVGAMVVFQPADDRSTAFPKPVARVEEDGTFSLTTYSADDGAPAGEYAVTIIWPGPRKSPFAPEGPDQLKGAYADPKRSRTRFTVADKSDNEVPTIRLGST